MFFFFFSIQFIYSFICVYSIHFWQFAGFGKHFYPFIAENIKFIITSNICIVFRLLRWQRSSYEIILTGKNVKIRQLTTLLKNSRNLML